MRLLLLEGDLNTRPGIIYRTLYTGVRTKAVQKTENMAHLRLEERPSAIPSDELEIFDPQGDVILQLVCCPSNV